MAILTAVFGLGKSLTVDPPPFTLINGCTLEEARGDKNNNFLKKLKDLIMKHPREKQTYSKQHENDLLKSSNVYGSSYVYGSKAGVIITKIENKNISRKQNNRSLQCCCRFQTFMNSKGRQKYHFQF